MTRQCIRNMTTQVIHLSLQIDGTFRPYSLPAGDLVWCEALDPQGRSLVKQRRLSIVKEVTIEKPKPVAKAETPVTVVPAEPSAIADVDPESSDGESVAEPGVSFPKKKTYKAKRRN